MIQACIAGLCVQFVGGDPDFFPRRLREYETTFEHPDLTMSLSRAWEVPGVEGEEILRRDNLVLSRLPDGRLARYLFGGKSGNLLQRCLSTADYAYWDYVLWQGRNHKTLSLTSFEYLYSGEAFANRLAYLGGLVMHGSAISFDGKGIIFSAPSGTGKSTHAGLWKQYYGDRVVHINDDKPALRFEQDVPYVHGTPWSGKTDTNSNISAPLHAIVFLKQAPENRIQRLSVADAMGYIHRETVRPFYDETLGRAVLATTERLIQSIPVFLLECTISEQAVNLVKDSLDW